MMKIKRIISVLLSCVMILSLSGSMNVLALNTGYTSAETLSGSVEKCITSSTQEDWYKFTLTEAQVPTAYSISLQIPSACIYNFDLRFTSANSTGRPQVISNETIVAKNRNRRMAGVFTEAGTYYVRVYSQDGSTAPADEYKLIASYNKSNNYSIYYTSRPTGSDATDWSMCADMLGNYTYQQIIKNSDTGRSYQNAYAFVTSEYASDSASLYSDAVKGTPEQIATAANYIYSGDLMYKPKFIVEENKIYTIEELMNFVWEYSQPVVFYTMFEIPGYEQFTQKRYYILEGVNIGLNTITYYNTSTGSSVTVDYDEFISDGVTYNSTQLMYTGTNVLENSYKKANQAIYD